MLWVLKLAYFMLGFIVGVVSTSIGVSQPSLSPPPLSFLSRRAHALAPLKLAWVDSSNACLTVHMQSLGYGAYILVLHQFTLGTSMGGNKDSMYWLCTVGTGLVVRM